MMLWFHLFGNPDLQAVCSPLIYIHGKALVTYLTCAFYPVTFFLILSGYGLTFVYNKRQLNVRGQGKRLLKLYIHYWVILLIFVSIGHFINPNIYPKNLIHIISNITGLYCTYNGETWFLFPYALISLTSPFIIPCIYRINSRRNILLSIIIYAFLFGIAKYIGAHFSENQLLNIIFIQLVHHYIILSFYFILGILLYRLLNEKSMTWYHNHGIDAVLILALIIVKSLFKVTILDGFYAFLFILLFIKLPLNKYVSKVFYALGRRSMIMWMTHTFFCVYLFHDFIYGFRYPIVIFLVLVCICYITSIPILYISQQIIKHTIEYEKSAI